MQRGGTLPIITFALSVLCSCVTLADTSEPVPNAEEMPPPLPAPTKQVASPTDSTKYFIGVTGANGLVQVGPLSKDDIIGRIKNHTIDASTPLWVKGMGKQWGVVCELDVFKNTCNESSKIDEKAKSLYGEWEESEKGLVLHLEENGVGYGYRTYDTNYQKYGITNNEYLSWGLNYKNENLFELDLNFVPCKSSDCVVNDDIIFIDDNTFQVVKTGATWKRKLN